MGEIEIEMFINLGLEICFCTLLKRLKIYSLIGIIFIHILNMALIT